MTEIIECIPDTAEYILKRALRTFYSRKARKVRQVQLEVRGF